MLPSFSTIPPSNNPFRFELCFRFLSLLYSPTGNEEEKNGGQRKRQNTETMDGTSLPVPKKSGVFPKDLEAAGPSKGRKAGKSKMKARKANGSKNPVPENEPDGVYPGAFEGKGKSRLKKKDNSHPSAHHPSEIVVSVKTGTATKEDLLAVTKALIEAKLSQQGPVDRAPQTQIRETSLEEGKVVVNVWDKASKNFAIKAVNKGGQYKTAAQEGLHARYLCSSSHSAARPSARATIGYLVYNRKAVSGWPSQ